MDTSTVKISERSWSARLLRFTFGIRPGSITNLCPYFWLTIASIILFPVVLLGIIFFWPFRIIEKVFWRMNYRLFCKRLSKGELYYLKNGFPRSLDPEIAVKYMRRVEYSDSDTPYSVILADALKAQGIRFSDVDVWEHELDKEIEDLRKTRKRTKKILSKIGQTTEILMTFLLYCGILLSGYILTSVLIDFIYFLGHLPPENDLFMTVSFILVIILINVLFFKVFPLGIKVSFRLWDEVGKLEWYVYFWAVPLWIVTSTVLIPVGVWKGIKRMSGLFGEYLRATYKDYCPGIVWEKGEKES